MTPFTTYPGSPYPLGATVSGNGVNEGIYHDGDKILLEGRSMVVLRRPQQK